MLTLHIYEMQRIRILIDIRLLGLKEISIKVEHLTSAVLDLCNLINILF